MLNTAASSAKEPVEPLLTGGFIQGGVVRGYFPGTQSLFIDGVEIKRSEAGLFVFGFGRDAPEQAVLSWHDVQGKRYERILKVQQREYPTQDVDGVPAETVHPPPGRLARIRAETRMVKKARQTFLELDHFNQAFVQPVDGPVTGVYGSQRVYNGVPKRPHFGIDYAAPRGTPVVAPAEAVVTLAHADMYYSGGTLIMDHGYGLSSTFIHLDEVLVKVGQRVSQGEVVGRVGSKGRSTGPHLDWRLNWYATRLDPAIILELAPAQPPLITNN